MNIALTAKELDGAKILLVDDNRNGLIVRKALLEEVGFAVETAGNGEDAFDLFSATRFDVVVTDFRMPRMDGGELIQRIRKLDPLARVILLSGFVEPLGLSEQSTGADVVLAKSANEAMQLLRAVKRLVNRGATRKPPASQSATTRLRMRVSGQGGN